MPDTDVDTDAYDAQDTAETYDETLTDGDETDSDALDLRRDTYDAVTALGDLLVDPIRSELDALPFGPPTELTVSPFGERASLVGALTVVLTEPHRFADRSQAQLPQALADSVPSSSPLTMPAHRGVPS